MKVLGCRNCLSFAKDSIFSNARLNLTRKGINWISIINTKMTRKEVQEMKPMLDHAFYDDVGFDIILDGRGFKPPHVKCYVSQKLIRIRAESDEMSMTKTYPGFPRKWNKDSGDCCMSSEGIILVSGAWLDHA